MRNAVWDEMVTAQRSGLVQALGVANFDNEDLLGSLIPPPTFLQVPIARRRICFSDRVLAPLPAHIPTPTPPGSVAIGPAPPAECRRWSTIRFITTSHCSTTAVSTASS